MVDREKLITIGEAAARAGIGRTTARRYAKEFKIYPSAGGGRFRLYDSKEVDKMIRISELYARGLTTPEIKKALFGPGE